MVQYKLEDYYKDLNTIKKPIFILDKLIEAFFPKVGQLFVNHLDFFYLTFVRLIMALKVFFIQQVGL